LLADEADRDEVARQVVRVVLGDLGKRDETRRQPEQQRVAVRRRGALGLSSFAAYLWRGLFTAETLSYLAILAPLYGGALFLGGWAFARTKGASYRPLTYVLVAFAALSSMPIFDGLLR
jgi:hypothetical protein